MAYSHVKIWKTQQVSDDFVKGALEYTGTNRMTLIWRFRFEFFCILPTERTQSATKDTSSARSFLPLLHMACQTLPAISVSQSLKITSLTFGHLPFSPTKGSDHVNTSMKLGNQYGWGEQLNCLMFMTLFSYFNTAAEEEKQGEMSCTFMKTNKKQNRKATW